MLCSLTYTHFIVPSIAVLIAFASFILNLYVVKKNNNRAQQRKIEKKADITYVEAVEQRLLEKIEENDRTMLEKINNQYKHIREYQEELMAIHSKTQEQVQFIYERHYKP